MYGRYGVGTRSGNVGTVQRIVLIGLSGVGKSSVGRLVADRLCWSMVDLDSEIELAYAATIPNIFSRHGEAAFRETERALLLQALARRRVVISCGGGATVDPALWSPDLLGDDDTLVVALDARPETSLQRLISQQQAEGAAVERPLLAGGDPLTRLREMKERRQLSYDAADVTLITDGLSPDDIATEMTWLAADPSTQSEPAVTLQVPSGASRIYVGASVAASSGQLIRAQWPAALRVWLVSDDNVGPLHLPAISDAVAGAGYRVESFTVPAGEASKCLEQVSRLYDWLLAGGIERGDVLVALGGGVVGDLVGFVAATVLRGVGLVQIPTSLLAMVDSSVGGKTGIDHAAGKNLIGAFYQPPLVIIDTDHLRTLPNRQVVNGWAEIIKHAIIQPSTPDGSRADLLAFIERNQRSLGAGSVHATTYLVRRNVALKASVVAADERESGIRAYLNYGHTLGHAIEAADYQLLHGEAVAIGMRGESKIGVLMDTCGEEDVQRIDAALNRARLPGLCGADPETVLPLLGSDKKRAAGKQRWVLPLAGGGVTIRDDVPADVVRHALLAVSEERATV
jgi:shikimate kinase/3-dehydroquinate synthase